MTVSEERLGQAVGELASGRPAPKGVARVVALAARSARDAGARAVASGRWLADVVLDVVPHLPIRDLETLRDQHGGLSGAALAGALIRNAGRTTAAIGATSGAMVSAEELAPPSWLAIPVELLVETLAIAAVEMKLIAELQEVYGQPLTGAPAERALALAGAWAGRRGVTPAAVGAGRLGEVIGRSARKEVVRLLRRRLALRTARNTVTLAPFFAGALAGAEVNRRATRALGDAVVRDVAARAAPRP